MTKFKLIQLNEDGKRIGESHGRAKLSDHEIELIRVLYENGMPGWMIASKFEISVSYCYKILRFDRRASTVSKCVCVCVSLTDDD